MSERDEPLFIARSMYRAGYLAGYEMADAGYDPHPDLTEDEVAMMLHAIGLARDAAR